MAVIKLGDLTTFTGDPSGSYLVINDPTNTATYKIQKEGLMSGSFAGTASYAVTASYAMNAGTSTAVDTSRIATGSVTASVNVGSAAFQITSGSSTYMFVSSSGNTVISGSASDGFGTVLTLKSNNQYAGINLVGTDRSAIVTTAVRAVGIQVRGIDMVQNSNSAINNSNVIRFTNSNVTTTYGYVGQLSTTQFGVTSNSDLHLQTNQTSSITIASSSGFVAVGRDYTTASYTLDVSGSTRMTDNLYVSGTAFFNTSSVIFSGNPRSVSAVFNNLGSGYSAGFLPSAGEFQIWHSNSGVHIQLLASNRTLLNQSVGFNTPNFGLNINDRITVKTSTTSSASTGIWIGNGTTNNNIFKVYGDGTVSIGQTFSPGYALQISGSTSASGSLNVDNVLLVSGSSVIVTGSGRFTNGLQVTGSTTITGSVSIDGGLSFTGGPNTANISTNLSNYSTAKIGLVGGYDFIYGAFNSGATVVGYHPNALRNGIVTQGGQPLNIWNFSSPNQPIIFGGQNNAEVFRVSTSGSVLVGTTTDSGDKLQVSGSTLLRGSGSTSTTNALTVQNSDAANILRVRNDGLVFIGSTSIYPQAGAGSINLSGTNLTFYSSTTNQDSALGRFYFGGNAMSHTSGQHYHIVSSPTFSPTSGTASTANLYILSTINQTGGANGITRGLYVAPTLTSAADWRSIEWSNNSATAPSASWGLYGAGDAPNYIGGNLLLGSTTNTGERLQVTGNSRFTSGDSYFIRFLPNANNFYGTGLSGSILCFGSIIASVGVNKNAVGSINANSLILQNGTVGVSIAMLDYGPNAKPTVNHYVESSSTSYLTLNGGYRNGTDLSHPRNFNLIAPLGTGTGTSGDIIFSGGQSGSTGTTLNSTVEVFRLKSSTLNLLFADSRNIEFNTTTGTKIGTATTQKLSFWNATPIVQPANTVAINEVLVNTGLRATGGVSNFTNNVEVTGSLNVTGSVTLTNLLTLATQNPLPTVNVPSASLMASGSGADLKPYFWNGSTWTALF